MIQNVKISLCFIWDKMVKKSFVMFDFVIVCVVKVVYEGILCYVCGKVVDFVVFVIFYWVLVQDDFSVQFVSNVQIVYVKVVLVSIQYKDLLVFFVVVFFKVGGWGGVSYYIDILVGMFVIKNVVDFYVYFNIVQVVLVIGVQVQEWLECVVGQFKQIDLSKIEL